MNRRRPDPADTYILDDEVMDEMENFDSTAVLEETWGYSAEDQSGDDHFLDDIESSTIVIEAKPRSKRS